MKTFTTTFDTSGKKMIQVFNLRVKIEVDFKNGFITRFIDSLEVDRVGFDKCFTLLDFISYQEITAAISKQYMKLKETE